MKSIRLLVLAAALAFIPCAGRSADAKPSTLFGDTAFGTFISAMKGYRSTTYTNGTSAEARAIDKALRNFNDPSPKFTEDLQDFAKALKALRPVFGKNAGSGVTTKEQVAGTINQASAYASAATVGIAGAAYAKDSPLTRIQKVAKADTAGRTKDEQKRLAKFVTLTQGFIAHANAKRINLRKPQ